MPILNELINTTVSQMEMINESIKDFQDQVNVFDEIIEALHNEVINFIKDKVSKILSTEIMPDKNGYYLIFTSQYGGINYDPPGNVKNWEIKEFGGKIFYTYTRGDYLHLDKLVDDYEFINDYLTRPLSSKATYGLIPNRDMLQDRVNMLIENKNKLTKSISILGDYIDDTSSKINRCV